MRVLVTGAEGFVGRHLVQQLQAEGDEVICGVRAGDASVQFSSDAQVAPFDLLEPSSVTQLVQAAVPDAVVHLAAVSSVSKARASAQETLRANVMGTHALLESVAGLPATGTKRRVLLVGSSEQYGHAVRAGAINEHGALRPGNLYGATKAAQEMLGWSFAAEGRLTVAQTRSFTHIGPGQRPPFVIADWATQLLRIEAGQQEPILRVGNIAIIRDITDVRDVVRAYVLLLRRQDNAVFNVCSGRGYRLGDLLNQLVAAAGVQVEIVQSADRLRSVDADSVIGDPAELQRATGWTPAYSIEETIRDLLTEMRESYSNLLRN